MLYVGSDNLIWVLGLINNNVQPAAFVDNATITVTVRDSIGNTVGSPFTLTNVPGSVTVNLPNGQTITTADGNYSGVLASSVTLVDGSTYYLTAVAVASAGTRTFRGSFQAGYSLN